MFINKKSNENYYHLRSMDESMKIKEKMLISENILIIGGGFIGLELASAANQLKKNVWIKTLNQSKILKYFHSKYVLKNRVFGS